MKSLLFLMHLFLAIMCRSQNDLTSLNKMDLHQNQGDGIFLTFEDFKNNKMIPKSSIVFDSTYIDSGSLSELLIHKFKIKFIDQRGKQRNIKAKNVFSFYENGNLFNYYYGSINLIPNDKRLVLLKMRKFKMNEYEIFIFYNEDANLRDEYRQDGGFYRYSTDYYLDMKDGSIKQVNRKNTIIILKEDSELYEEFNELKFSKITKDLLIIYLNKFIEKHPLDLLTDY